MAFQSLTKNVGFFQFDQPNAKDIKKERPLSSNLWPH